uniref:Uncharacterized protein n=1 Tax=Rhizophora mucronata TaxID=61149 RepID=A0A2P2L8F1_RHIMU
MVLLDKLWDDVAAGPPPDRGLGRLRKITTNPLNVKGGSLVSTALVLFDPQLIDSCS